MALISLGRTTPGSTSDANANLNNNWTLLETLANGGIDNANLAAAAAVVGTKLLPVRVATTVAGLGTAADGALGQLRVGSTPFEFLALVYDATYGKWVSAAESLIAQPSATLTTTNTTYSTFTGDFRSFVPNAKALYDAGLRPQVYTMGFLFNSGANTTYYRIRAYEGNDGSTFTTAIADGGELSHVGTTGTYKFLSGWVAMTVSALSWPHWVFTAEGKVSAGTGNYQLLGASLRWVSA
jgi:hypothetical protein